MSDVTAKDIEALLQTFEASDWSEMKLKIDGLDLFISKSPGARPSPAAGEMAASAPVAPASAPAPVVAAGSAALKHGAAPDHWIAVRAPNLGTFYRSPKPGAPPYVELGQRIEPMTELCLIEVMKLFTSVFAGVTGVVRQVMVEDSELVEFDQVLFLIEPDA
ncbi:MAG TPA: biotin/lipoyl-containing protein [Roseiarcus sp.]|nr:biotin/lipoyl-containing protein [Roseiarcus sp.]